MVATFATGEQPPIQIVAWPALYNPTHPNQGQTSAMTTIPRNVLNDSRSLWVGLHVAAFLSGFLTMALALACLPAATLAAVCPYCVRLLLDRKDRSGTISGRLSGLATAGSILGTLGTSFFFILMMGISRIYNIVAAAGVLMGLFFLVFE